MATTIITIDRPTRDLLREALEAELYECYELLQHAVVREPEEAQRLRPQANYAEGLLDALGWAQDDDRTRYELPANRAPSEWLARLRASVVEWPPGGEKLIADVALVDRLRGELDEQIGAVA
jgi:hypothetical protein